MTRIHSTIVYIWACEFGRNGATAAQNNHQHPAIVIAGLDPAIQATSAENAVLGNAITDKTKPRITLDSRIKSGYDEGEEDAAARPDWSASRKHSWVGFALAASLLLTSHAYAFEANDQLEVNVIGAGALQCLDLNNAGDNGCEGALALQTEISLKPIKNGELFAKVGFAEGNSLATTSPFALSAWAADLEGDLENINGRSRDHLLTAWYEQVINLGKGASLAVTGGIIDATDYLDDNAFANDEYGQFLNEVFVNAPTANLQSYDVGAVTELDVGPVSLRGVFMEVGANDDGNAFNFYGGQASVNVKTRFGEGTYRVIVSGTDRQFLDPTGTRLESLTSVTLSLDQELGEYVGVFARLGWQDDAAAITHETLYSGGLSLAGALWGREKDTIGLAFAHLDGGNGALSDSQIFEAYYRLGIGEHFAVTADVQHMSDRMRVGGSPQGAIFSLRGTAEF